MENGAVERAFELAETGAYRTVLELQKQLNREGYFNAAEHLSGSSIRGQLNALLKQSRAPVMRVELA